MENLQSKIQNETAENNWSEIQIVLVQKGLNPFISSQQAALKVLIIIDHFHSSVGTVKGRRETRAASF